MKNREMLISILFQLFVIFFECKNLYSKEIEVKLGAKIDICCSLKFQKDNSLNLLFLKDSDVYRLAVLNHDKLNEGDWLEFTKIYSDFSFAKRDNTICLTKEQSTKKEQNLSLKCTESQKLFGPTLQTEDFVVKIFEELRFSVEPPDTKTVSVGDSVTVTCEATGSPDLKVLWRKEGEGVLSSGSSSATLEVKDVVSDLNGKKYTCEASINITKDNTNSVITHTMTLNVLYKPKIIVTMKAFHTDLAITEVIKIKVTGNPRPKIDCQLLDIIASKIITISEPIPFTYVYELEIGNITKEHLGNYKCVAKNSVGTDEEVISLILGPENLVIVSSNKTSYSNYYLLEWTVQSKAKITTSKITIDTYETDISSTSSEKVLTGLELSPKVISEGTSENNWLFKYAQSIMNLTSNKLHKISVQMCRNDICIDAQQPAYVRTQVYDGKNNAVLGDLKLAQTSGENIPLGVAPLRPMKMISMILAIGKISIHFLSF